MKKQKDYQNVTNYPLLTADPEARILGILAIPELHCLIGKFFYGGGGVRNLFLWSVSLGIVDKLLKEFENRVFPTKIAGRQFVDNYLKKVRYHKISINY